jgi:S1-C subfamily serine protease
VALIDGGGIAALLLAAVGVGAAVWLFSASSAPTPNPTPGPAPVEVAAGDPNGGAARPNVPGGGGVPAAVGKALRYRWQGGPHVYAVNVSVERDDHLEVHQGNCVVHVRPGGAAPVQPADRKGTGTGFVVHGDGYLITCAHVVADATKVEVAVGGRAFAGTVLAVDHDNDLAIVRVPARGLPTVPLGNSDAAELGQEVRALGFPLSSVLGDNIKATRGTLSGINRKDGRKVFQIDASINPGNSGGPLVNESGAVIGVNSAKLAGVAVSNVGFATPSNEVARLLRGKGVAFATALPGAKLDGPTLVKRVVPAVALITVTVGPGAASDTYQLTCGSSLGKRQQPRPGVAFRPGRPSFSSILPQQSVIDMDATGKVLQARGGTQLPALLGEVGLFLVEPLPPDGRGTWETTGTCTIEESSGGGFPFGPRFMPRGPRGPMGPMGPRGPIGPPGFPGFPGGAGGRQSTTRQAIERSSYTRGVTNGDTVTIQKRYELKADPVAASPGLSMTGDGQITFDLANGLPRAIDYKATLMVGSGNAARRLPIVVSYRRLEGAERDRVLNPPPPPKLEPKPFTEPDLTQALADLQGMDRNRRRAAMDRLAKAKPVAARRAEVAKALVAALEDKDFWARKSCLAALTVWGTGESVPKLLPLVTDENVFVRHDAMMTLGKIGDERAAEPIARRLGEFHDRGRAAEALKALGSKAEKAVVPYLTHTDWGVRLEACRVLAAVGTKASQAALEKASGDSNGLVAGEAKRAVEAIGKR